MQRAEELSRSSDKSLDQSAALVVEDLETAAGALNSRTAPLVPGCGVLVATSGLLLKAEPSSHGIAEFFVGLAVLLAVAGFSFLARALFVYAGRRTIGLPPSVEDIAFARAALARKRANANRGSWLAGIALACLIAGILSGVRINLG